MYILFTAVVDDAGKTSRLDGSFPVNTAALSLPSAVMVGRALGWRLTAAAAALVAAGALVAGGVLAGPV